MREPEVCGLVYRGLRGVLEGPVQCYRYLGNRLLFWNLCDPWVRCCCDYEYASAETREVEEAFSAICKY
jgi:hypothetical protein